MPGVDDITNDIAQFMGMLDPWYERNVLSFLGLACGCPVSGMPPYPFPNFGLTKKAACFLCVIETSSLLPFNALT